MRYFDTLATLFLWGGWGGVGWDFAIFMKKIEHIFPFSFEYNLFLQKSCKYILSANQKCVPRNSVVTVLFGCNNKMCCYLAVLKCFAFSYCKWAANLIVTTKEHCNYNLWHLQHFVCRTCGICSIMYAGLAAFCMQDLNATGLAAFCMQDLRHFVCKTCGILYARLAEFCMQDLRHFVYRTCGILYSGLAAFAAFCMQYLRHFVYRTCGILYAGLAAFCM